MTQETTLQHYRGILCGYCRQPIPVPRLVEKIVNDESEGGEKRNGTFHLRCRACEREKPYGMNEIVEIEGSPRPRSLRARHKLASAQPRLARAASG